MSIGNQEGQHTRPEDALTFGDVGPNVYFTTYVPATKDSAGKVIHRGVFKGSPDFEGECVDPGYFVDAHLEESSDGEPVAARLALVVLGITPNSSGDWGEIVTVERDPDQD